MRVLLSLTIFVVESAALLTVFSREEDDFIRKHAPKELLDAYSELLPADKVLLYHKAAKGDLLTTLLTENERLVHLSSTAVEAIGKKIARLDGKAKKFVIKIVHNVLDLAHKVISGEEFSLKRMAEQEQNRFRGLSQRDKQQIQEQFPILTSFGLFTNERLSKIIEDFAAFASKAKEEL